MSGVSAQFQNGTAKSIIKSVVQSAWMMMLHAQMIWPAMADETLWPQALQYAVYLHNIMPTEETGVSPVEVWTRTKSNHSALLYAHTRGSPAYVLSPRLREGGHVPKWEPRSKRGQFVGYSPLYASNVGMIRNLNTGYVSPQFHMIHDDFFETMHSDEGSLPSAKVWKHLYTFNYWTPWSSCWVANTRWKVFLLRTEHEWSYWGNGAPRTATSEGGRSSSSYNPASRSSNWGSVSSWNPSSSICKTQLFHRQLSQLHQVHHLHQEDQSEVLEGWPHRGWPMRSRETQLLTS